MRERVPGKTLGDYVTIAFSPLLIMSLVGSLVFFLLEVLYGGQYSERLQWTLFWFVFAMVLIARIAIEQADGRAGMYGLGLGAAVFVSLQMFIEYPPGAPIASFRWAINLGLMALIWWCAHRLVWDCTYIDDKVDDSGAGLLDASGLQAEKADAGDEDSEDDTEDEPKSGKKAKKQPLGFSGWLDRYRLYRERRDKKPHSAGVWVVYFSLAALPLFGLGQALIPAAAGDRRRYVFWLMVIYVGSGLGLLLTTSYLGLRRYLRQRKLTVPVSLTAAWLAMGSVLIATMLLIGALLPRPYGEYQLIKFKPFGSSERDASKYAVKGDGAGKGDGRASSDPKASDAKAKDGSGTKRSDKSSTTTKGGKSGGSSKGDKGGGSQKGSKGSGKSGKSDSSNDKNRDDSNKDASDKSDRSEEDEKDKERDSKNGPNSKTDSRGNKTEGKGDKQTDQKGDQAKQDQQDKSSSENQSSPPFQFLQKLGWLGTLLKWVVFAIIALVVVFFILRSGLRWLANFTIWAQNLLNALSAWWNGLFGGGGRSDGSEQEEHEEELRRPRPFASYSNPFRDGTAQQSSPEEVARYTFAAFEAWANDHDMGRSQQETPLEFFERVARLNPGLAGDGKRMLGCYVRVAYARSRLTPAALPMLEKFWNRLEGADAPDLAAKAAWEDENGS